METFIFETLIGMLRSYLFKSAKLAKYAKYALRIRDYLIAFFPTDTYPVGSTGDALLDNADVQPVPTKEVEKAAKENGFKLPFNIPFVPGI